MPSGPFLAEKQQMGLVWAGRGPQVKGCCRSRGRGRRPYLCVSSVPQGPRPILCKTLGGGGGDRERDSHHRQGSTLSPASAPGRDPRSRLGGGGKREYYPKLWPVTTDFEDPNNSHQDPPISLLSSDMSFLLGEN